MLHLRLCRAGGVGASKSTESKGKDFPRMSYY